MPAPHGPNSAGSQQAIDDIREITDVVQKLIGMMDEGNIHSMDLSFGALQLSLKANGTGEATPLAMAHQPANTTQHVMPAPAPPQATSGHVVSAPMIGTFYVAPAPNEPAFVQPGDQITEGQTIGIIEAMKIMNEIAADRAGIVVEIVAADGETVEYGSPLVIIEPVGK